MENENKKIYKLNLSGQEINVDKEISEDLAYKILVLLVPSNSIKLVDTSGNGESTPIEMTAPKVFMVQKKPGSDIERIACLAYYLAHNRNTPEFKTEELTGLSREAQQIRLSNPSAAARNAVQAGYLSPAGGGRKQITTIGEAVVEALPNRDKVKEALENIRRPQPRRTKKNKTTQSSK